MSEGYLCEQGERPGQGYSKADFWCWQETLTFCVKLDFANDSETEYFRRLFLPKCIISCSIDVLNLSNDAGYGTSLLQQENHFNTALCEHDILLVTYFPQILNPFSHICSSFSHYSFLSLHHFPAPPSFSVSITVFTTNIGAVHPPSTRPCFLFISFKIPKCPQFVHLAARHETIYELIFSLSPPLLCPCAPEAAAINLNGPLSVLSAVRIGCLWFAQAEF